MKRSPRRGRPPIYRDKIKALKVRGSIYFQDIDPEAAHNSIKSIASHLGDILNRQFSTRREDGGVVVYREI